MNKVTLSAEKRDNSGKGVARKLRASGQTPGILYSKGSSTSITMATKNIVKLLTTYKYNTLLVTLDLDGKESKNTIIKDLQVHPVSGKLVHLDMLEVKDDQPITVELRIEITGSAAGVKEGGCLVVNSNRVIAEALPADMPNELNVDVTSMQIGDTVMLSNVAVPENVKLHFKRDNLVVKVDRGRDITEAEEETATEETPAE